MLFANFRSLKDRWLEGQLEVYGEYLLKCFTLVITPWSPSLNQPTSLLVQICSITFILHQFFRGSSQCLDMRGTMLTEWFFCAVLFPLHAVCSLCSAALTRACVGMELPFAALAGGFLGLSLHACTSLRSPPLSRCLSFFILTPLWGFLHFSLWRLPHEFFSLLNVRHLPLHHSPLSTRLLLLLSLPYRLVSF